MTSVHRASPSRRTHVVDCQSTCEHHKKNHAGWPTNDVFENQPRVNQPSPNSSCLSNMDLSKASEALKKNFDLIETAAGINGKDGIVGPADLEAIQNKADAPQELKDACKFLLENPTELKKLDKDGDELFDMAALNSVNSEAANNDTPSVDTDNNVVVNQPSTENADSAPPVDTGTGPS